MKKIMIDVREKDEFEAEHVRGSVLIPLSEFETKAPSILSQFSGKEIVFMCRSGKRASLALDHAKKFGIPGITFEVYDGGILKWKEEGKPTITKRRWHFPIMRQVQIIAGTLVIIGTALAYSGQTFGYILSGAIGLGLSVAGITGFCGMANLLALMPWNRGESPNIT